MVYARACKLGADSETLLADSLDLAVKAEFERVMRNFPFREYRELSRWGLRDKMTKDGFAFG